MVRSPLKNDLLDEIISWLTRFVPKDVSGIEVTGLANQAASLQHFISNNTESSRPGFQFNEMPKDSKSEVQNAWSMFNWNLRDGLKSLMPPSMMRSLEESGEGDATSWKTVSDESQMKGFLGNFASSVSTLQNVIQRNVLAVPESQEAATVLEALADSTVWDLGLHQTLRLRVETLQYDKKQGVPENDCAGCMSYH